MFGRLAVNWASATSWTAASRKAGNRVRIIGQLIDAITGVHLWADRFEGNLADIFQFQDQVTINVVGAIEPKIRMAEIERALHKPTSISKLMI